MEILKHSKKKSRREKCSNSHIKSDAGLPIALAVQRSRLVIFFGFVGFLGKVDREVGTKLDRALSLQLGSARMRERYE